MPDGDTTTNIRGLWMFFVFEFAKKNKHFDLVHYLRERNMRHKPKY